VESRNLWDPAAFAVNTDERRMSQPGKLVVVTGPSGAGKSTILAEALARTGAEFSVSATTRPPRPGEVDGVDYRFVDRETFEKMAGAGEMLEWAEVHGGLYGTPAGSVREAIAAGRTIVLDIDIQGGLQVARTMPDATFVLIEPPDDAELARRLRGRGTDDDEAVARRLGAARKEVQAAVDSGVYNHRVVNDDLATAVGKVVRIIQGQESCAT
jgi:guanylate kinase